LDAFFLKKNPISIPLRTILVKTLAGYARIYPNPPQPGGLFPFLTSQSNRDASSAVSLVSFAHRQRSSGGAFTDYTARYGAVFEQDRVTLRESMFSGLIPQTDEFDVHLDRDKRQKEIETTRQIFEMLVDKMKLQPLLDLPMVALSNGQTRRARIVRALLVQPELMLLDEPFSK
jgi:ABC-type sugar transport system ATPase subunit